ncbi:GNAT family N-acetyltransferase [Patescibacteria group bacterium]
MEITIEKLSLYDLDPFWLVFKTVLEKDFPGYSQAVISYFLTKVYNKASFHYWLTSGWKIVLIAKVKEQIVGFAVLDKPYGGVCFCRWLGVVKGFRNKGAGKKLIAKWLKISKSFACHKVELASQPEAKAFYEKCSLSLEGERKLSYFGIDQYIFGKVIGKANDQAMTND